MEDESDTADGILPLQLLRFFVVHLVNPRTTDASQGRNLSLVWGRARAVTTLETRDTRVTIIRGHDRPGCQLWFSERRPALDPRVGVSVNPVVYPLANRSLCKVGVFIGRKLHTERRRQKFFHPGLYSNTLGYVDTSINQTSSLTLGAV